MWLPAEVITAVDDVARIYYIGKMESVRWNEHRKAGELRMLSGWCWAEKSGEQRGYGLKTMTVAYRDAWYKLVAKTPMPKVSHLRVVRRA